MIFDVAVEIRSREGLADPEGLTIERALPALGFEGVHDVRVGKMIRFRVEADDEHGARRLGEAMCERFLANPVIERFEVQLVPNNAAVTSE